MMGTDHESVHAGGIARELGVGQGTFKGFKDSAFSRKSEDGAKEPAEERDERVKAAEKEKLKKKAEAAAKTKETFQFC